VSVYATLARFIRDSTAAGRALLTAATAGDQRSALGLGTAAQSASTDFAAAVHNHDDRYFTESEITSTLASYLTTASAGSTYVTISTAGSTYQPLDSDLTAIAALTTTTFGRSLLTQADAAAARSTIGAGTSSFDGAYSSLSGVPSTFTPSAHNQAWSTITSTPTTLAEYGITDAITSAAVASGYLALSGGTLTGPVTFFTATTGSAAVIFPMSSATPSAPLDGGMWYASSVLNFRVSATTRRFAWQNVNNSFSAKQNFWASNGSSATINIPHGSAASLGANALSGDVWSHTSGWFVCTNSVAQRLLIHAPTQNTYTPAGAGTATLLLSETGSNLHQVTRPTSGNITIAFSGDSANQSWLLCLDTSSTGTPGTVTWPAGITWLTNAGSAPTLSAGNSKTDSIVFMRTGASTYIAWHTGQN
jgi:hypothetical protein